MTGLHLAFLIVFIGFLFVRTYTLLTYFQQEEYDSKRFLSSFIKIGLIDVLYTLSLILVFWVYTIIGQESIAVVIAILAAVIIGIKEFSYKYKKKLAFTNRARRIFTLTWTFTIIVTLAISQSLQFNFLAFILALQIVPFLIILANLCLRPLQEKINQRYINEARDKLYVYDGIKIGITGSFGKTTVKTILAYILSSTSNVFHSPGSINTVLGLTRHIRQRLQPSQDVFIAEMGAYGIGSIQRLSEFIMPEYAIITSVGNAHSERFGNLQNTAKAKSELAQWICKNGAKVVIPEELLVHEAFKLLYDQYPDKFLICGYNQSCDVQIHNTQKMHLGWKVKLSFNYLSSETHEFKLPLYGKHNHMNLCVCLAMFSLLYPNSLPIARAVSSTIPQTPHRLQIKALPGSHILIDDAYNSNKTGFKNAVEVLQELAKKNRGRAILITPGIAELGEGHDEVHAELGEFCASRCDQIFVVNGARIPSFVAALEASNQATFKMFESFTDAKSALSEINITEDDVVLLENDLPDILEVKRFL